MLRVKEKKKKQSTLRPTIVVLFGITGDLAQRKVLPALFDLFVGGHLSKQFALIGFSRRSLTKNGQDDDDGIRAYVRGVIAKKGHTYKKKDIDAFLACAHYQAGDFTHTKDYGDLAEHFVRIEERFKACANKLFHLAVPPKYYSQLFKNLAQTGLTVPCSHEAGWSRILVEKPFGSDIDSAQKLDRELSLLFKEEQIFRIDHYLGKEMLQDIIMFRFANSIFEPVWNHRFIEKVDIVIHEDLDVLERGAFYDGVGALRDVGANHALQMLALVAMDRPTAFTSDAIRTARARAISHIRPLSKRDIAKKTVRAQYKGYRDVDGVLPGSETETFFHVPLHIDTARWSGVPFHIQSGKALNEKRTEIKITFKAVQSITEQQLCQNVLTFCIQPCQEIRMTFATKKPGFTYEIEKENFVFSQMSRESGDVPDAYEKVMYDCIHGDQTMFTSSDEVVGAWKLMTPILQAWKKDVTPLHIYNKGSKPDEIC